MKHTVYKVTNKVNNKLYIGVHSTENLEDDYFGSSVHLNNAINKYGLCNFVKEILFIYSRKEKAYEKEAELVTKDLVKSDKCYNKKVGGIGAPCGEDHPFFGCNHSEEQKEKWSKERSGKGNYTYGKPHTEETKKKIGKAHKGRKASKETLEKMSGKNNHMFGKKQSKEVIEKKRKASSKEYKHKPTGKIFSSGKAAANWAGISYECFRSRVRRNSDLNEFCKL